MRTPSGPVPTSHTSELRVRYAETDQMGVVYHAHYLVWCEVARTDYIRALGTPYAELERSGVLLAVADASLRYHASARYDDRIHVTVRLTRVQSRAVTFAYEITAADEEPPRRLVSAETKLVVTGRDGRPRPLPPELLARFRAALEEAA